LATQLNFLFLVGLGFELKTSLPGAGHSPFNPSYSEGRDQENHSSKPGQANSSVRPYLEKPFTKNRAGGMAQGEGQSSSPSTTKKKKQNFTLAKQVL
jgi:hypothetical protein